jgi:hypothetical protein
MKQIVTNFEALQLALPGFGDVWSVLESFHDKDDEFNIENFLETEFNATDIEKEEFREFVYNVLSTLEREMGDELAQDAGWADVEKYLLGNVSLNAVAA